jgi:DNA-binding transcriptional regulator YhcF (GntR family)
MFVATGAPEALRAQRRDAFTEQFVRPFVDEGRRLGLSIDEIVALVTKER